MAGKIIKGILKNLYPYIIGVFPVITLYIHNYFQVEFFRVERSLLAALLLTGLIEGILWLALRKAAAVRALTSYLVLVLFNYGSIYIYLAAHPIGNLNLGRARILLTALLLIFAVLLVLFVRKPKSSSGVDGFTAWFSLALVGITAVNFFTARSGSTVTTEPAAQAGGAETLQTLNGTPNVYHIILDGYTSAQALQQNFDFDNSQIENDLEALGFVVPDHAYSNYDETIASLGTALNMDWVENVVNVEKEDHEQHRLVDRLVNSRVRSLLAEQGYQTFAFENEFRWSLWSNADFYESPRHHSLFAKSLNSFEVMFLEGTVLRLAENYDPQFFTRSLEDLSSVNLDKYEEQSFALERLPDLPTYITPRFVFAHLTVTHVPFVFALDGSLMPLQNQGTAVGTDFSDPAIREGYVTSIQYMNAELLPIVEKILADDPNAIIIIQGDHGYPGKDRHQIFLAVYDPKNSIAGYDCVTPVNLYRLIFNNWFGTDYALLPDNLYKTIDSDMHQFEFLGTCEDAAGK